MYLIYKNTRQFYFSLDYPFEPIESESKKSNSSCFIEFKILKKETLLFFIINFKTKEDLSFFDKTK